MNCIISQEDWEVIADRLMQEFGLERRPSSRPPYNDLLAKKIAENDLYQSILYVGLSRENRTIHIFVANGKIGIDPWETELLFHSFSRTMFFGNFSDTSSNLYMLISMAMSHHKK